MHIGAQRIIGEKMERFVSIVIALAVLIALTGCTVAKSGETGAPGEVHTEAPGETPADRPTDRPYYPQVPKTGNLTGGEIFPEPAEYLVINGESDVHYVFDRFGELVDVFHCEYSEYNNWYCAEGFYGKHGAPYGYSIERRAFLPNVQIVGDIAVNSEAYQFFDADGEVSVDVFITGLTDAMLEREIELKDAPEYLIGFDAEDAKPVKAYRIGFHGGILKLGENYLIIERDMLQDGSISPGAGILIAPDGSEIGPFDTTPFGTITGTLGGKYVIASDTYDYPRAESIYTLTGELVAESILPLGANARFCADEEVGYPYLEVSYYCTENGDLYDKELKKIGKVDINQYPIWDQLPADAYAQEYRDLYESIGIEGVSFVHNSVFTGVMNADGEWLFRIYSPHLSMDAPPQDTYR